MKLIDVSVPLDARLPTYPGNTPFSLEPVKRIAGGDSSNVSTLHMSAHTGTHVDAPRHFFDDRPGTEALPLDMLIGRTRVIEVASRTGVSAEDLSGVDLSADVRLLIKTLGLVNCTDDFKDQPQVINGFSELMADVFGEDAGVGARSAIGTNSLPGNISVEIECIFEVTD